MSHPTVIRPYSLKPSGDTLYVSPSQDPEFIFSHNPLHCGAIVFRALLDMEKLGLGLASHHNTILAMSHLTNALRQLGLLDKPWDDFDAVVEQQKSALFASAFPTKYSDMMPRLMTRRGFSAANFAHYSKTRGYGGYTKLRKNWDVVKFRKGPAGIIFRQYFAGSLTMEQ